MRRGSLDTGFHRYGKAKGTVSEHIKHIFEDEELTRQATVRLIRTVQKEGGREVEFYNIDLANPCRLEILCVSGPPGL